MKSFTNQILMIQPANFGYNPETAINNAFQEQAPSTEAASIQERARKEFDGMVAKLREAGVEVFVWEDSAEPIKPDAVFPNNWFSTTPEGWLITYPMFAVNRRVERDPAIIQFLENTFEIRRRYTLEHYEGEALYLEGTGSLIFDHDSKVIYACLSPRTDIRLLDKIAVLLGYEMVPFHSVDRSGVPIYHTNVMMAMGLNEAVVCLDSIPDHAEKERLVTRIEASGKSVLPITFDQLEHFAGNMIQLRNDIGQSIYVMSVQAHESLSKTQIKQLEKSSSIVAVDIETIETYGGGSARCMIAELFADRK